jgi:hypothetical protein
MMLMMTMQYHQRCTTHIEYELATLGKFFFSFRLLSPSPMMPPPSFLAQTFLEIKRFLREMVGISFQPYQVAAVTS